MTSLKNLQDKINEEFREKFVFEGDVKKITKPVTGGSGGGYFDLVSEEEIKSFLTTATQEAFNAGLEEARRVAEGLRKEHPTICKVWDDVDTHCTCDMSPITYNRALTDLSTALEAQKV